MVEEGQTQVKVAKFKAFSISLGTLGLLIVALFSSWANVRVISDADGQVYDIWNLKFSNNYYSTGGGVVNVPQGLAPDYIPFLMVAALLLLVAIILQLVIAASLERSVIIRLKSKTRLLLSWSSIGVTAVLLLYLMFFLPGKNEFPSMFNPQPGPLIGGAPGMHHTEPGMAWFALVFAVIGMFLQAMMLSRLQLIEPEVVAVGTKDLKTEE